MGGRNFNFTLLIANLWFMASFFAEGLAAGMMIFLGLLWLLNSVFAMGFENTQRRLKNLRFKVLLGAIEETHKIKKSGSYKK